MVTVTKKELEKRTFVPYEVTIRIESREDHFTLKRELTDLQRKSSDTKFFSFTEKYHAIGFLCKKILEHI